MDGTSMLLQFDKRRQRRKLVAPFLCKDSSSVLTCLVFLSSSELAALHSLLGPEEGILKAGSPVGGGGEEPLKIRSWRSTGNWVRENNVCSGLLTTWSAECLSPWPIVAQTWILHLGVKNGEFWGTEFTQSILKSTMNDFICGSQHLAFLSL